MLIFFFFVIPIHLFQCRDVEKRKNFSFSQYNFPPRKLAGVFPIVSDQRTNKLLFTLKIN